MAQDYALKSGFRVFFIIIGVIALPIFLLGVPVLWIAFKAYAKTDAGGIEYRWLSTKRIPWEELCEVSRAPAAGVLGAMLAPYTLGTVAGKRHNFPSGAFVGGDAAIALAETKASS